MAWSAACLRLADESNSLIGTLCLDGSAEAAGLTFSLAAGLVAGGAAERSHAVAATNRIPRPNRIDAKDNFIRISNVKVMFRPDLSG